MKKILLSAAILAFALMAAGCSGDYIGTDAAKQIALYNAGVTEGDVIDCEVDLENEAGTTYYDITFDASGYEYEYEIEAGSGEILRSFRELDDATRLPTPTVSDETPAVPAQSDPVPEVTEPAQSDESVPETVAPETPTQTEQQTPPVTESPETPAPTSTSAPTETAAPQSQPAATVAASVAPVTPAAPSTTASTNSNGYIGNDAAANIALKHAGYTASEVYDLKTELDSERGVIVYDVSFDAEGYDYDYEIDPTDGEILRSDKERDNDAPKTKRTAAPSTTSGTPSTTASANSNGYIGNDAAADIALKHAGYTASEVYDLKTELDSERGVIVYDVSFDVEGYDYDYEIDATTGEILRSDKERDNDAPKTKRTEETSQNISADTAKANALSHAGLAEKDVREMEAELDYERGKAVYDVSFKSGGYEYDYEIDAVTGKILRSDKERD